MQKREGDRDVEIARDLLAGDAGALDRFIEVFQTRVFQYSYLMCGQREDAEEVAQETLLKVFENFEQLREPEHVKSWVFQIARNNCLMKRRKSVFAPAEEIPLEETSPDRRGEAPDEQAHRGEVRHVLNSAIRRLQPIYRAVVLLRDVEELTTDETAQILGVSTDVVKTRLHRARLALREDLESQMIHDRL